MDKKFIEGLGAGLEGVRVIIEGNQRPNVLDMARAVRAHEIDAAGEILHPSQFENGTLQLVPLGQTALTPIEVIPDGAYDPEKKKPGVTGNWNREAVISPAELLLRMSVEARERDGSKNGFLTQGDEFAISDWEELFAADARKAEEKALQTEGRPQLTSDKKIPTADILQFRPRGEGK